MSTTVAKIAELYKDHTFFIAARKSSLNSGNKIESLHLTKKLCHLMRYDNLDTLQMKFFKEGVFEY